MSWDKELPRTVEEVIETMNQFTVAHKAPDPVEPPTMWIRTWSNVFGKGGSVTIEVLLDGVSVDVGKKTVKDDREVRYAIDDTSFLIEEWNENPRENWRKVVEAAREQVLEYTRRQAKKYAEDLARYEAGEWT